MKKEMLRSQTAKHVTMVGFWTNAFLSVIKVLAGVLGKSQAMLADGIHSMSDFLTDIVVIVGFKLTERPEDEDHTYGHGKYETLATVFISIMLVVAAVGIFKSGLDNVIFVIKGGVLPKPSYVPLIVAALSIVSKEVLFRYTLKKGEAINSGALKANAWHHRSDAMSSIGTFIGIGGAVFLGQKFTILDPIASLAVGVLIVKVAIEVFKPAMNELLESALPASDMDYIREVLEKTQGILEFHEIRARKLGNRVAIECHMMVDPQMNITQAHNIATKVERTLFDNFGEQSIITIHIEPYDEDEVIFYREKAKRIAALSKKN